MSPFERYSFSPLDAELDPASSTIYATKPYDLFEEVRVAAGASVQKSVIEAFDRVLDAHIVNLEALEEFLFDNISDRKFLLDQQRGPIGNTPLHEAIRRGDFWLVDLLLDFGASKEIKNRNTPPQTALELIAELKSSQDYNQEVLEQIEKLIHSHGVRFPDSFSGQRVEYHLARRLLIKAMAREVRVNKNVVLLCGLTQVGKSTLANFLQGVEYQEKKIKGNRKIEPVSKGNHYFKTGTGRGSVTLHPEVLELQRPGYSIVDMPGFSDQQPNFYSKLCAAASGKIFTAKLQEHHVHAIVLVMDNADLSSGALIRYRLAMEAAGKMLVTEGAVERIILVITRAPDREPSQIQEELQETCKQLRQEEKSAEGTLSLPTASHLGSKIKAETELTKLRYIIKATEALLAHPDNIIIGDVRKPEARDRIFAGIQRLPPAREKYFDVRHDSVEMQRFSEVVTSTAQHFARLESNFLRVKTAIREQEQKIADAQAALRKFEDEAAQRVAAVRSEEAKTRLQTCRSEALDLKERKKRLRDSFDESIRLLQQDKPDEKPFNAKALQVRAEQKIDPEDNPYELDGLSKRPISPITTGGLFRTLSDKDKKKQELQVRLRKFERDVAKAQWARIREEDQLPRTRAGALEVIWGNLMGSLLQPFPPLVFEVPARLSIAEGLSPYRRIHHCDITPEPLVGCTVCYGTVDEAGSFVDLETEENAYEKASQSGKLAFQVVPTRGYLGSINVDVNVYGYQNENQATHKEVKALRKKIRILNRKIAHLKATAKICGAELQLESQSATQLTADEREAAEKARALEGFTEDLRKLYGNLAQIALECRVNLRYFEETQRIIRVCGFEGLDEFRNKNIRTAIESCTEDISRITMAPTTHGAAFAAAMGVDVSLDGEGIATVGGGDIATASATSTARQRRAQVYTEPTSASTSTRGSTADAARSAAGDDTSRRGTKRGDHPPASAGDDTPYGGWAKWQQHDQKSRERDQATVHDRGS